MRAVMESSIPPGTDLLGTRSSDEQVTDEFGRRIEDWVASNLDDHALPSARDDRQQMLDALPSLRRPGRSVIGPGAGLPKVATWAHFRTIRKRGVTVVRLVEHDLVKETDIRELTEDLLTLIGTGSVRILLDFGLVDHLASWIMGGVAKAFRQCAAANGGLLKICGLKPELANLFEITGLTREVTLYPDEASALDSPWAERSSLRPLPIQILTLMTASESDRPTLTQPLAPTPDVIETEPPSEVAEPKLTDVPRDQRQPIMSGLWLVITGGRSRGRAVPLSKALFFIGRDPSCHLRPASSAVSRFHAVIERRGEHVRVRDLGSTNGTMLNDRMLLAQGAEIREGDRIQVGPITLTVATRAPEAAPSVGEDRVASWLRDDTASELDDAGTLMTTDEYAVADEPDTAAPAADNPGERRMVKHEVLQGALVITPILSQWDEESALDTLRTELRTLFSRPLPRQVVINLEYVTHLSSQAIGIFVAHHLKLDRVRGTLRIAAASARVMSVLEQVRLSVLVGCFPTLDEAVLFPWPTVADREAVESSV